jgi:hypothetical protein
LPNLELDLHHILQPFQPVARTAQLCKLSISLHIRHFPSLFLLTPIFCQQKLNHGVLVVQSACCIADYGCGERFARERAGRPVVFLLFGELLFGLGCGERFCGFFDEFASLGNGAAVVSHVEGGSGKREVK